jgi:hypothetical protein
MGPEIRERGGVGGGEGSEGMGIKMEIFKRGGVEVGITISRWSARGAAGQRLRRKKWRRMGEVGV